MGSSSTLGLLFEISADPSKADKALVGFGHAVDKYIGAAQGTAAKTGAAFVAAGKDLLYLGGVAAGLVTGAVLLAKRWSDAGTAIYEAAEKTGLSAEKLSGLRVAAMRNNESFETLTVTLARMEKNISVGLSNPASEAGKVLHSLFQTTKDYNDFAALPMAERIQQLSQRINGLSDVGDKNAAKTAMMSRGWMAVNSTMADLGEKGYDPLIARAKALNQLWDIEAAAAARQFGFELKQMGIEVDALAMGIGRKLIPTLSQMVFLAEVKLQQSLGKNLLQALRDAGVGLLWMNAQVLSLGSSSEAAQRHINDAAVAIAGGSKETQGMTDALIAQAVEIEKLIRDLKRQEEGHQAVTRAKKEEKTETAEILRLASELGLATATTDAEYREYLKTLNAINRLHDEQARQALAQMSEQRFAWELLQRYAKLSKDEQEWRIKATQSMHAETVEIKAQNAAWNEALATRLKIHPQTVEFIREMNQAGISTKQLREEVIRTFVLGLPSSLNVSREALGRWANDVKIQVTTTRAVFVMLKDTVREMEAGMAQALGQSIAAAIVYQKSIGAAMAAAVKAELAGIAGRALVKALWETAEGIACLATWNFAAAALHFKAAAIYGVVGGVAAGMGRAIPGGEYGGGGGGYAAGPAYGPARTAAPPALAPGAAGGGRFSEGGVTVIFQGPVYGGKAGIHELVTDISQAVERQGARLISTESKGLRGGGG